MDPLKIVFMGTADLSCPSLQALLERPELQVVAVVTQPDKPKGRELHLQPSPVKALALRVGVPVLQPAKARNEDFLLALSQLAPDLIVVVAYGQILPKNLLELPRFGCINVHTSLLPKYRGAAPIQWAIINGDRETGVTVMKMDVGLDTGAILAQARTPIDDTDNSETLHDRLAQLGAALLVRTIPEYCAGRITPVPQPREGASYAAKIKKEDGRVDWSQPAKVILNRWRGLYPWPGSFTFWQHGDSRLLLKLWQLELASGAGRPGEVLQTGNSGIAVGCGEGAVRILTLQREGGKRLAAQQFLAGHQLRAGELLG